MTSYSFTRSNKSLGKYIKSLCTPAYIYFILAFISTIMYLYSMLSTNSNNSQDISRNHYTIMGLICKIAWHVLFLLFLDYLCRKGFKTIAWVALFLPFILFIMLMIMFTFLFSFISATDDRLSLMNQKAKDKKYEHMADEHDEDILLDDGRPSITYDGMLVEGFPGSVITRVGRAEAERVGAAAAAASAAAMQSAN